MIDPRLAPFHADVERILTHLKTEYSKLQTGRANPSLVEHLKVEAYGQMSELRAVAGVSISDARTIVIQPWDRGILANIEKAIQQSNLGINPLNDGVVIRLALPSMNEERRLQLKKIVHQLGEEAKIAVRKSRQDAHDRIKPEKDEDVRETLMEQLQKEVESSNDKIVEMAKKKEEEIMKI